MAENVKSLQSELVAQVGSQPSPTNNGLILMLYRQMYKRWTKFCELHDALVQHIYEPAIAGRAARTVPALPANLVQQFITNNIQWAKLKVQQRINRIIWGQQPSSPIDVDTDGTDDEYDPVA